MWGCEEECGAWDVQRAHSIPARSWYLMGAILENDYRYGVPAVQKILAFLAHNYILKAKSINSCCCRGLTFVPHTHGHMHTDSLSTILLHQCLQGLRRAFFGGMQKAFHLVRACRGTNHSHAGWFQSSPDSWGVPPVPQGLLCVCCDINSRGHWFLRVCVTSGSFKKVFKDNINLTYFKATFEPLCTVRTIKWRHLCINKANRPQHWGKSSFGLPAL